MKPKVIIEKLLAEVRGNAIESVYRGGIPVPHHHRCDLCGTEWKPGQPEAHDGQCLISMTNVALEQMPEPGGLGGSYEIGSGGPV